MNWCSRVSSTAPRRVQVDIRVRELELPKIRGVSHHRSGPVRPDSSHTDVKIEPDAQHVEPTDEDHTDHDASDIVPPASHEAVASRVAQLFRMFTFHPLHMHWLKA